MDPIIHKSGDAVIYVGIARSKSLQHLVPGCTTVHEILPGLSFFAIGIFKYDSITDLRPGNEGFAWKDLFDITVQVPVDYRNARKLFFMHRLYNTNREVVEWAKGDFLNKIPSRIKWNSEGKSYNAEVWREDGMDEYIELRCEKKGPLPGFLWKFNPFNSLVNACLMSEYQGLHYVFDGLLPVKRSYWGTGSFTIRGLDLPAPLMSACIILEEYDPLKIMPIYTLYHQCSYTGKGQKSGKKNSTKK